MAKSRETTKTRQKFDFGMEPNITTLLSTCSKIIDLHLVCCCSLPVGRRSFLKKGTPCDLYWPSPGSAPDGSGQNALKHVRDPEHFIHTKFHQNQSSGSVAKADYVFL